MEFSIKDKRLCIIGRTGSGKSVLFKHILKTCKNEFDKIFLISLTESVNSFFSDVIDSKNIYNEFSEEWLVDLIAKLTKLKSEDNNYDKRTLLIFDDCGSDPDFQKSKALSKILTMGRHLGISVAILLQYYSQVPPIVRCNINYLIIGQLNERAIQILADNFHFGSITRKDFIKFYHQSTNDYTFMIIKCDSVKNNDDINAIYGSIRVPDGSI